MNFNLAHAEAQEQETYGRELAQDKADRLGLRCVFPADNELQIDLDDDESYEKFMDQLELFRDLGYYAADSIKVSKSGLPHRHATVTLDFKPTLWQRIALQTALGSDCKRELLSCDAALDAVEQPTAFFELPTQPGHSKGELQ